MACALGFARSRPAMGKAAASKILPSVTHTRPIILWSAVSVVVPRCQPCASWETQYASGKPGLRPFGALNTKPYMPRILALTLVLVLAPAWTRASHQPAWGSCRGAVRAWHSVLVCGQAWPQDAWQRAAVPAPGAGASGHSARRDRHAGTATRPYRAPTVPAGNRTRSVPDPGRHRR